MQILRSPLHRIPAVTGTFCLLLATLVAGCASKNPLMEEPAPIAKTSKKISPVASAPAISAQAEEKAAVETASAVTAIDTARTDDTPAAPVAAIAAAPKSSTGVQTKREKRFLGIFRPYRPDIQQGNFVSQEMVAQLKEGMTEDQVIFLLGTPLLNDVFHADRWDYAFRLQKGNGEITTSRVTVFFKDKLVSHFEGGDLPTEKDYLERISNQAKKDGK